MEPEGSLSYSKGPVKGAYSEPDESGPRPVSLRFIVILPSYLHRDPARGLITSDLPAKILCAFVTAPVCATYPNAPHPRFYHHSTEYITICSKIT
jgi:hypothetical protein